jgi:hypothetical protein
VSIAGLASDQAEGSAGIQLFTFVVSLDQASIADQAVVWTVGGVGAHRADADDLGGSLPAGILNFAAGETSKTVTVAVSGDTLLEFDEDFIVRLTPASNGLVPGAVSATATIRDDDRPAVSVAATQAVQPEGASFIFTLTLDEASPMDQTVVWSVSRSGAHAVNALDFGGQLPNGTVTFAAGETSTTVTVSASADPVVELDETFAVTLSNASAGLAIGTALAMATIANDDSSTVSIVALSADKAEGEGGTTAFTFRVSLDRTGVASETIVWTASGSGDHPASAADFAGGPPNGTVTFAAGETARIVTVLVSGDTVMEFDEGFTVSLSNASPGLVVAAASAVGTIRADERAVVAITAQSTSLVEGDTYLFTVTLDRTALTPQSVAWSVTGSGAHAADLEDFAGAMPSGTVIFAAGETSKSILVSVSADTMVELDETFTVALAGATAGLALGTAAASAQIENDDVALVSIAARSAIAREGDSGATPFTFTLTLDRPGASDQIVSWSVTSPDDNPADPADFGGGLPSGTATFAAGETSRTVTVSVSGDSTLEPDDDFTVTLSNASADLAIAVASATGTILNDDSLVSVAVLSSAESEGASFTFVLTRTGDLATTRSVAYTVSGLATAADFAGGVLPSGIVTFAADVSSQTVVVAVAGDSDVEPDETFTLALSSSSPGLVIAVATAAATIVNDDASVSIAGPSTADQPEGAPLTFVLTRTGDLSGTQSVTWTVTGLGADAADFAGGVMPSSTVSFAAGESVRTIVIDVAADTTVETTESFQVTLSGSTAGLAIGNATTIGTIFDDDASVAIAALVASQSEGTVGATTGFVFVLTLAGDSSVARSVSYTVTGTGASPAGAGDFVGGTLPSGTVSFAVGETSKAFAVQVAGDASSEPNETFTVTLSSPSPGLVVANATATATIVNDDTSGGDPVWVAVVANDDMYTGLQDEAVHVVVADGLLFNDTGTRPLAVSVLAGPAHGVLTLVADGSFDYVPDAGFAGVDSFTYRAAGTTGDDDGTVILQIAPVSTGPTTTLDLLSLSVEQQIAAVYTAFFGRGADAMGFAFWVGEFTLGLTTESGATLLGHIANAFGLSDEAVALYPFLAAPAQASDGDIEAFLDTVYDNLFARSFDAAGLAYWANEVKERLAADEHLGGVLVDIVNGAQNGAAGQDITTLMGKVTVNLEYVRDQRLFGTTWTPDDDGPEAKALINAVTDDPATVLTGIAQARALVIADLS